MSSAGSYTAIGMASYKMVRWKDCCPRDLMEEADHMPASIPDQALELFEKPALAHLATLMPDDTLQVTPIWIDFDGTYILVNTLKGRQKALNMERRPQVGLDILDPHQSMALG